MIIYRGGRRQRGYGIGGVFSSLFRQALPALEQGAKIIGKNAVQLGMNVANDAIQGKDPLKSLEQHGVMAALNTGGEILDSAFDDSTSKRKKRKREGKNVIHHRAKRQKGRGFTDIFDDASD